MCGCGWDDNVKGNEAASKTIWDRDALTVEIMTDSSDDPPFGRLRRGADGRGLIHVITRHIHTRCNRGRGLCFIDNPNMWARGGYMSFYRICLHYIVQAVCVHREKGEAMGRGRRSGTTDGRKGREEKKQEKRRGKREKATVKVEKNGDTGHKRRKKKGEEGSKAGGSWRCSHWGGCQNRCAGRRERGRGSYRIDVNGGGRAGW